MLNQKNKVVSTIVDQQISRPVYIGHLDHDEIVSASVLELMEKRKIHSFKLEAELKREFCGANKYKNESSKEKYPDAIVTTDGPEERRDLAIELELSRKSRA
ncbi:MAG: hypothetical protein KDD43_14560, partial [Bdellovibrionales bacterium]|nr:hypothetical protein [Bdellovibrionales bacterium]